MRFAVAVVVGLALSLALALAGPLLWLDGPAGVLAVFAPTNPNRELTRGFTRLKLVRARVQASREGVVAVLGEPFSRRFVSSTGEEVWCYSRDVNFPEQGEQCRGLVLAGGKPVRMQ